MIHRSFQIGDHFVARNADHSGAIRGAIVDIDKEYYHVDWGEWGKKLVPISWVESLRPWTLWFMTARGRGPGVRRVMDHYIHNRTAYCGTRRPLVFKI